MVKISIIVPVYNVEDYLGKCLESLVNQTLKDIEIIVVNDGSPDNSQKIIDKYQKKYPKIIKAFKKSNGGLSDARNFGLKKAKGEYIGFVDSDDYIELDMYEKMYQKINNSQYDVVVCDSFMVFDNNKKIISSGLETDINNNNNHEWINKIYPSPWNKLYSRNLFKNNIFFKKGVWYEDVEIFYRLVPFIKSIGVIKEPLIDYVQRSNAITKTFDRRLYDYIDNWNGIISFYKKNNYYNEYQKELEYCYVRYLYCTFVKGALNFNKEQYQKAYSEAQENVKKYFPHYRKNNYFYSSFKGIYMLLANKFIFNILFFLKKDK